MKFTQKKVAAAFLGGLSLGSSSLSGQVIVDYALSTTSQSISWTGTTGREATLAITYDRIGTNPNAPATLTRDFTVSALGGDPDHLWNAGQPLGSLPGLGPNVGLWMNGLPSANATAIQNVPLGTGFHRDATISALTNSSNPAYPLAINGQFTVTPAAPPSFANGILSSQLTEYQASGANARFAIGSGGTSIWDGWMTFVGTNPALFIRTTSSADNSPMAFSYVGHTPTNFNGIDNSGQNRGGFVITNGTMSYSVVPEVSGVAHMGVLFILAAFRRRR